MLEFPLTTSDIPLEPDTLPALKARFSRHGDDFESRNTAEVYTLARLYLLNGCLQLSLTAFERTPPPESRMAFALGAGDTLALVTLSPDEAFLSFYPADAPPVLWAPQTAEGALPLPAERFAGVDEQGWYWGARMALPKELPARAGFAFTAGGTFKGALYKYRQGCEAFGASVPPQAQTLPPGFAGFDDFKVVDY